MPGKNVGEYAWRYLTPFQLYREVTPASPDTPSSGNNSNRSVVDNISEVIDLRECGVAYSNRLLIGILLSGGATNIRVEIYADMGGDGDGVERWCLWRTKTGVTESVVTEYQDVPPTRLKIQACGVTTGKVRLMTSHTP